VGRSANSYAIATASTRGSARTLLRRLGQFLDQFIACFSRQPQRDAATQYIDGLFGDSERKSMQAMHGRLGDARDYQALQHFITHSPWDARAPTPPCAIPSAARRA
jgi:SRSO17 transposase